MIKNFEIRDKNGLTEEEFLENYKKKNYPRPYLTADIVLFDPKADKILLIKRKGHPFLGRYALPGGFACRDESIEETAQRELREETSVKISELFPVGLYSKPGRDPRGWVVSQAFLAFADSSATKLSAGDDADGAAWFDILYHGDAPAFVQSDDTGEKLSVKDSLSFDHGEILTDALKLEKHIRKDKEYV